jgi:uncharacterized membrane protein YbhN (UPF0104 family)
LSLVAGIITQVPGGMGVFELSILLLLAPAEPAKLFAVMAVWRAIFYLLPLAVAAMALAVHEVVLRTSRRRARRDDDKAGPLPADQSPDG